MYRHIQLPILQFRAKNWHGWFSRLLRWSTLLWWLHVLTNQRCYGDSTCLPFQRCRCFFFSRLHNFPLVSPPQLCNSFNFQFKQSSCGFLKRNYQWRLFMAGNYALAVHRLVIPASIITFFIDRHSFLSSFLSLPNAVVICVLHPGKFQIIIALDNVYFQNGASVNAIFRNIGKFLQDAITSIKQLWYLRAHH